MLNELVPDVQVKFDKEVPLLGKSLGLGPAPHIPVILAYFFVEWKVGTVAACWWVPICLLGNHIDQLYRGQEFYGMDLFWFATVINASSWIAQFIGHGLFEKRAPALATNLKFALLAPFFITFEVMNKVFGYADGPNMDKVKLLIQRDIDQHHGRGIKTA